HRLVHISVKFIESPLSQPFNQDCIVNPSAANEGKAGPIRRDSKMRDFFVAQIADEVRILIVERLPPERISGTVGGDVVETIVVAGPGDPEWAGFLVSKAEAFPILPVPNRRHGNLT